MALENPRTFLRSIKGAPASVLWALMFTRIPMTNRELQDWTGYSDKCVTDATRQLVHLGWVTSYSRFGPWSVAPGRQLLAIRSSATGAPSADSSGISGASPGISDTSIGVSDAPSGISDASIGISASSSSSGTYLESTNLRDKELLLDNNAAESPNSGPEFPMPQADFAENLKTLIETGIREPAASMLASLPHVTPAYVREHVEQILAEGKELGAAIYRMRRGWLPPAKKRGRQEQVAEAIRRFAEGE